MVDGVAALCLVASGYLVVALCAVIHDKTSLYPVSITEVPEAFGRQMMEIDVKGET